MESNTDNMKIEKFSEKCLAAFVRTGDVTKARKEKMKALAEDEKVPPELRAEFYVVLGHTTRGDPGLKYYEKAAELDPSRKDEMLVVRLSTILAIQMDEILDKLKNVNIENLDDEDLAEYYDLKFSIALADFNIKELRELVDKTPKILHNDFILKDLIKAAKLILKHFDKKGSLKFDVKKQ